MSLTRLAWPVPTALAGARWVLMTKPLKECEVTLSILPVKIKRHKIQIRVLVGFCLVVLKDDVPNISPVSCLFQDSAVQVREGEETAHIAKKCFNVVSFIRGSRVIILCTIPGKCTSQNGPEISIFPVEIIKVEFELSEGVMSLHVGQWSWWGDLVSKIHLDF